MFCSLMRLVGVDVDVRERGAGVGEGLEGGRAGREGTPPVSRRWPIWAE